VSTLGELAQVLRSKNAGPFLVTIDIMFDTDASYQRVIDSGALTPTAIAPRYGLPAGDVRVVGYARAKAIKVTLPRLWGARGAGSAGDRDVYGAQQHAPLLDIAIP
jgi:Domain of unknown function (DUF4387)